MQVLEKIDLVQWQGPFAPEVVSKAADVLENGKLIYAPRLPFALSAAEQKFLSPDCLDGKSKNISYRPDVGVLKGSRYEGSEREALRAMLSRYYECASAFLMGLCPRYAKALKPGFTSFRPVQIAGRGTSWRHDDTRLHIDAFPSRPMQGLRILRVFTNVNPTEARVWRVGEDFEQAASRFVPTIKPALPGAAALLRLFRVVKGKRTVYDHLMLGIHDGMKSDQRYQAEVGQMRLEILPGTTWACYTDLVSHAAMSGQFAFEQTFYLPVGAMKDPDRSPLRILERMVGKRIA
jgi:hypothetical protein